MRRPIHQTAVDRTADDSATGDSAVVDFSDLCGRDVAAVQLLEWRRGPDRSLIAVWLAWADGGGVQLRSTPRGHGLTISSEPLGAQAGDMAELGRLEVVAPPGGTFPLGRLLQVDRVFCAGASDMAIGLRFTTGEVSRPILYSHDDELELAEVVDVELGPVRFEPLCAADGGHPGRTRAPR